MTYIVRVVNEKEWRNKVNAAHDLMGIKLAN